jgi:hypothetical protein
MRKYVKLLSIVLACAVLVAAGATFAIAGSTGLSGATAVKAEYEPKEGDRGCTPGYWKQVHPNSWFTYKTTDLYDKTFGVTWKPTLTLLGALNLGGGGYEALARHATAALLNAANPNVNYGLTTSQIIAMVQKAFKTGQPEQIKNELASFNEVKCSIDAHGKPIP